MGLDDDSKTEGQKPSFVDEDELPSDKQQGNIPETSIQYPSKAYSSFRDAYTYRISELIFGSLLASYILGFVSFASKNEMVQIFQSLLISVVFCYITAAYYVTYHNTILTMPHLFSRGLRFDFFIAIEQAILFGFSMIWPDLFLIFLSLSLLSVFARQTIAYTQLASVFENATAPTAKGQSEWTMDFLRHRRFRTALASVNPRFKMCLNGWLPISCVKWLAVSSLLLFGCVTAFYDNIIKLMAENPQCVWCSKLEISESGLAWVQVILDAIILVLLLLFVNRIFKDRAARHFVYQRHDYKKRLLLDMAAEEVVKQLKKSQKNAQ